MYKNNAPILLLCNEIDNSEYYVGFFNLFITNKTSYRVQLLI